MLQYEPISARDITDEIVKKYVDTTDYQIRVCSIEYDENEVTCISHPLFPNLDQEILDESSSLGVYRFNRKNEVDLMTQDLVAEVATLEDAMRIIDELRRNQDINSAVQQDLLETFSVAWPMVYGIIHGDDDDLADQINNDQDWNQWEEARDRVIEWCVEFNRINEDRMWDGEWKEEVEEFVEKKLGIYEEPVILIPVDQPKIYLVILDKDGVKPLDPDLLKIPAVSELVSLGLQYETHKVELHEDKLKPDTPCIEISGVSSAGEFVMEYGPMDVWDKTFELAKYEMGETEWEDFPYADDYDHQLTREEADAEDERLSQFCLQQAAANYLNLKFNQPL